MGWSQDTEDDVPHNQHSQTLELIVNELGRVGADVKDVCRDTATIKVQLGKLEGVPDRIDAHERRLTKQEIEVGRQGVRVKTLWAVAGAAAATIGGAIVWLFQGA